MRVVLRGCFLAWSIGASTFGRSRWGAGLLAAGWVAVGGLLAACGGESAPRPLEEERALEEEGAAPLDSTGPSPEESNRPRGATPGSPSRDPASAGEDRDNEPDDDPASERAHSVPTEPGSHRGRPAPPATPSSGCAFSEPARAHAVAGWFDIASAGDGFLIAGTAPTARGEEAFILRVPHDGPVESIARVALDQPVPADRRRASPALNVSATRAALALVDGEYRLLVAVFDPRRASSIVLSPVATGASLRFTPALAARSEGWALAWTDEGETPMRVHGALLDPHGRARGRSTDLTPVAGGAAAPVFLEGSVASTLVFVDPREGMSVAHRVALRDDGFGRTEVVRPIGLVAAPPEMVAVRIGSMDWLGYTAVGNLATAAVGLLPLEGTAPPVPLVRGTGYGVLHVDAARWGDRGAVFVADAPRASPPDSPRELHVRTVGASGAMSEPAVVRGPSGGASRGRIAVADPPAETVATVFTDADGTYVAIGRCARFR